MFGKVLTSKFKNLKMLAESALALAQDDLPVEGGFWTPASAMGDALLKRLPLNAGVNFTIED